MELIRKWSTPPRWEAVNCLARDLSVLNGQKLVYIERTRMQQIIHITLYIGSLLPPYNTSMRRALGAHKPESWFRQHKPSLRQGNAQSSRSCGKKLLDFVRRFRRKRYTLNNEDLARELQTVAPQIGNQKEEVAAAVNIAVPSARVTLEELEKKYALKFLVTAADISSVLGCTPCH